MPSALGVSGEFEKRSVGASLTGHSETASVGTVLVSRPESATTSPGDAPFIAVTSAPGGVPEAVPASPPRAMHDVDASDVASVVDASLFEVVDPSALPSRNVA